MRSRNCFVCFPIWRRQFLTFVAFVGHLVTLARPFLLWIWKALAKLLSRSSDDTISLLVLQILQIFHVLGTCPKKNKLFALKRTHCLSWSRTHWKSNKSHGSMALSMLLFVRYITCIVWQIVLDLGCKQDWKSFLSKDFSRISITFNSSRSWSGSRLSCMEILLKLSNSLGCSSSTNEYRSSKCSPIMWCVNKFCLGNWLLQNPQVYLWERLVALILCWAWKWFLKSNKVLNLTLQTKHWNNAGRRICGGKISISGLDGAFGAAI